MKSEAEAPQEAGSGGGCDDLDAGLDEWRAAEEKMREKSLRESIARERELEKHVASLVAMGFVRAPAKSALQATGGDVDRAIQMLSEPSAAIRAAQTRT